MNGLEKKTFYITVTDGHDLFVRTFTPKQKVIGHIHLLHGLAEHSKRYEAFAQVLCNEG